MIELSDDHAPRPRAVARRRRARRTALVVFALALVGSVVACAPAAPGSRCSTAGVTLTCSYRSTTLTAAGEPRKVLWQVPVGDAPAGGWPTVIMFQGTGATPELTWSMVYGAPFGAYRQTQVVQLLLDAGYAVITPATHLGGLTFWDTNNLLVPDYSASNDHALMLRLFDAIDDGTFGDASTTSMYATGISSGGYMTSRMALAYPGRFKALAIAAGSYATCANILCSIGDIPADHPPTLFLHGLLDPVVPIFTMDAYDAKLRDAGIETRRVVDALSFHEWIPQSPPEVLAWFQAHP